MSAKLTSALAAALLEALFFLESHELGDEADDAAVEVMESIGFSLQRLSDQERAELKGVIASVPKDGDRPEFAEFAAGFLENFGLD